MIKKKKKNFFWKFHWLIVDSILRKLVKKNRNFHVKGIHLAAFYMHLRISLNFFRRRKWWCAPSYSSSSSFFFYIRSVRTRRVCITYTMHKKRPPLSYRRSTRTRAFSFYRRRWCDFFFCLYHREIAFFSLPFYLYSFKLVYLRCYIVLHSSK